MTVHSILQSLPRYYLNYLNSHVGMYYQTGVVHMQQQAQVSFSFTLPLPYGEISHNSPNTLIAIDQLTLRQTSNRSIIITHALNGLCHNTFMSWCRKLVSRMSYQIVISMIQTHPTLWYVVGWPGCRVPTRPSFFGMFNLCIQKEMCHCNLCQFDDRH